MDSSEDSDEEIPILPRVSSSRYIENNADVQRNRRRTKKVEIPIPIQSYAVRKAGGEKRIKRIESKTPEPMMRESSLALERRKEKKTPNVRIDADVIPAQTDNTRRKRRSLQLTKDLDENLEKTQESPKAASDIDESSSTIERRRRTRRPQDSQRKQDNLDDNSTTVERRRRTRRTGESTKTNSGSDEFENTEERPRRTRRGAASNKNESESTKTASDIDYSSSVIERRRRTRRSAESTKTHSESEDSSNFDGKSRTKKESAESTRTMSNSDESNSTSERIRRRKKSDEAAAKETQEKGENVIAKGEKTFSEDDGTGEEFDLKEKDPFKKSKPKRVELVNSLSFECTVVDISKPGYSNQEIQGVFFIERHTNISHLRSKRKYTLKSSSQVLMSLKEHGLIRYDVFMNEGPDVHIKSMQYTHKVIANYNSTGYEVVSNGNSLCKINYDSDYGEYIGPRKIDIEFADKTFKSLKPSKGKNGRWRLSFERQFAITSCRNSILLDSDGNRALYIKKIAANTLEIRVLIPIPMYVVAAFSVTNYIYKE